LPFDELGGVCQRRGLVEGTRKAEVKQRGNEGEISAGDNFDLWRRRKALKRSCGVEWIEGKI
jgi:hypothetical protein